MTDKELSNILNDLTVIVDTREWKNQHIIDYLDTNNLPYITEKLNSADYSFILPHYSHLNLDRTILIEKKNSLDEIAGNFTKGRARFAREFERAECKRIHLLIENATWQKLYNGSYRSQFPAKSMQSSILTWQARYNCPVWFVERKNSPELIYNILHYELREILKKGEL